MTGPQTWPHPQKPGQILSSLRNGNVILTRQSGKTHSTRALITSRKAKSSLNYFFFKADISKFFSGMRFDEFIREDVHVSLNIFICTFFMYKSVKRSHSSFNTYLHLVLNPEVIIEVTEADLGALGYSPFVAIHSFIGILFIFTRGAHFYIL